MEKDGELRELLIATFNAVGILYLAQTGRTLTVTVPHGDGYRAISGPSFDPNVGPSAPVADEGVDASDPARDQRND